jgi:micrococcal nuclease
VKEAVERSMNRRQSWLRRGLFFALLALCVGCSNSSATPTSTAAPTTGPATTASRSPTAVGLPNSGLTRPADAQGPYPITEVVDGDTAKVTVDGTSVTLRLIGIDTPETKDPRKPVECGGPQASAQAEKLLTGRNVWIQYDSTQDRRDKYGRDLVYLWLDTHTMYNQLMVAQGYAHEYTYHRPYRYRQQFLAAQSKARAAGLGFWSRSTCAGDTTQRAGAAPPTSVATITTAPAATDSAGAVYYSSCAQVRAAGKAPLLRGQPGYRSGLDGDHNGVACQ